MRDEQGYVLLECLIALTLFSMAALGAITGVRSLANLTALSHADARHHAAAENLLNGLGLDVPLRAGVVKGDFDPETPWTLEVRPYRETTSSSGVAAFVATVSYQSGVGARQRLSTLVLNHADDGRP